MSQSTANPSDALDDEDDSPAAFSRPRRPMDDEIDMTPMIDCVFLLLIFFIVTFQADPSKSVPLAKAKYGNGVLGIDSAYITLARGEGDSARGFLGDQITDDPKFVLPTNAIDREQKIIDYIDEEMRKGKKQVVIKADGKLKSVHIAEVAKAVGKAESAPTLHLAVLQEAR